MEEEQKRKKEQERQEQALAREQRKEFQEELAVHNKYAGRSPASRSRVITFIGLAVIAVCAGIFGWLVLLPSASPTPVAAVGVGTPAPNFTLPVYGGSDIGRSIDLRALRGHPVCSISGPRAARPVFRKFPTWN